jgi:hypothetical protein
MLQQAEFFRNKPPESGSVQQLESFLLSGKKQHCLFPDRLNDSARLIYGHGRLGDKGMSEIDKPPEMPDSFVFFHDFSLGVFNDMFAVFHLYGFPLPVSSFNPPRDFKYNLLVHAGR